MDSLSVGLQGPNLRRFPPALAWCLGIAAVCLSSPAAELREGHPPERNVDGIMDNSFLVEEAYNQEKGVVQHILNAFYSHDQQPGPDDKLWLFTFTQEWPLFSQKHQLSYTIPYSYGDLRGSSQHGLWDILINYRYQAFLNERTLTAFAPRASLILPTGDTDLGFSEDSFGAQFNLPFSTTLGPNWFLHLNAGLTYIPDAESAQGRELLHYNLGASVIYAATRDLHFLLEWVGYWTQFGEAGSSRDYRFSSLLSPGVRKAFNFDNGAQLVLGLAVPVGLTASSADFGAFFYVSFEHSISRTSNDVSE